MSEPKQNSQASTHVTTYRPVGRCIYCHTIPSDETELTDEHIIPEGMGGKLILPSASCYNCAEKTSYFELRCQRSMFPMARAFWNLYGKRRKKKRPQKFTVFLDKGQTKELVSLSNHPITIMMPLLQAPGILVGRQPEDRFPDLRPEDIWSRAHTDAQTRAEHLSKVHAVPHIGVEQEIPLGDFSKLLAKIAHSFTIAEMGYGTISTFLEPLILCNKGEISIGTPYYIGCAYDKTGSQIESIWPGKGAYTLQLRDMYNDDGYRIYVVRIQLFAHAGAPVYEVVVGGSQDVANKLIP